MKKVIIIGGGAAGMMAAYSAARAGGAVTLYEKNEKLGKKLYITGKGRCNFTNARPMDEYFDFIPKNPRFLYSAFSAFTNRDMMKLLEENSVPVKTERGQRVFPASDHASDVTKALSAAMKKAGVSVVLNAKVEKLLFDPEGKRATGVLLSDGTRKEADAVIIATGGLSYQTTGSTGDGYTFARLAGHSIKDTCPSLVPLKVAGDYPKRMEGLALKNVRLSAFVKDNKKPVFQEEGELLFTSDGISGPLALTLSSAAADILSKSEKLSAVIDLKTALSEDELDSRIVRDIKTGPKKVYANLLSGLLPRSMVPVFLDESGIPAEKLSSEITREERKRIVSLLKAFPLTVTGTGGYNEAVITRGGVAVNEISPKTMSSKLIEGLYFAGEVIDVDAFTGGYNLQIAWSTGFLAGKNAGGED